MNEDKMVAQLGGPTEQQMSILRWADIMGLLTWHQKWTMEEWKRIGRRISAEERFK